MANMGFSDVVRTFLKNAFDDGCPMLLGTSGENGPNISPKGSMFLFDDDHLAYWERSKRSALENLQHDKRVVVFYNNMKAQLDGKLDSGFLRFFGVAELHESGGVHDAIFARLTEREATHAGADVGIGVLIKIDRAEDVRGRDLRKPA
jgi:hypothetical protein